MTVKKKKSEVKVEPEIEVTPKTEDKIIKVERDGSPRFTREQLVNSNRYKKYAYILEVKLDATDKYTLAEVDKLISEMV